MHNITFAESFTAGKVGWAVTQFQVSDPVFCCILDSPESYLFDSRKAWIKATEYFELAEKILEAGWVVNYLYQRPQGFNLIGRQISTVFAGNLYKGLRQDAPLKVTMEVCFRKYFLSAQEEVFYSYPWTIALLFMYKLCIK